MFIFLIAQFIWNPTPFSSTNKNFMGKVNDNDYNYGEENMSHVPI